MFYILFDNKDIPCLFLVWFLGNIKNTLNPVWRITYKIKLKSDIYMVAGRKPILFGQLSLRR